MAVIPDELIQKLEAIARQENRTPAEVLSTLLEQYPAPQPEPPARDQAAEDEMVRQMILRMYARARRYWREHDEPEKAQMSDAELDEQFWLFDHEGIPRLKSEENQVQLPPDPLMMMVEAAEAANLRSGQLDLSERSSDIYAEYLNTKRTNNGESTPDR